MCATMLEQNTALFFLKAGFLCSPGICYVNWVNLKLTEILALPLKSWD